MKTVHIGLLGFGVVGQGVWQLLQTNQEEISHQTGNKVTVKKILVRDPEKNRVLPAADPRLTTSWQTILQDAEIDVIVELMGGIEPAKQYITEALSAGKHVVTANKALLAQHGSELSRLAARRGVQLRYEASVAGGIPILQAIRESLCANRLTSIMGIVNGTTNYILSKMTQEKTTYEEALAEAQAKGYAEADPTADVEGFDAAHKLTILASLGFQTTVEFGQVYREGINSITPLDIEYAAELGYVIKLLAIARDLEGKIELRVHPTMIAAGHPLASVQDAYNAVYIQGNAVGDLMFYGKGAGDLPTASAVMGDVLNVAQHRNNDHAPTYPLAYQPNGRKVQSMDETTTAYYVRLLVKDIPGVLGRIATTFGNCGVSLSSVIQKGDADPVSLVFVTHRTREIAVQQAIKDIRLMDELVEVAGIIRVEDI
ncbi:homoserine dehydrogenase [Anoxynatronum buryatiense]|uniref:Homoserine dehydrogenase n=1 Tax=Anoxynatronum buryatiense TaxID=489973 RepID=A0AA45WYH6_9CLOT|nr:homoserine dehydrogenase [Anoxynatronum buryatiense]SMP68252.1 homoserine dehydrogenase [Anoxynatronum buryatiense]